jgi:hypothetical protein
VQRVCRTPLESGVLEIFAARQCHVLGSCLHSTIERALEPLFSVLFGS